MGTIGLRRLVGSPLSELTVAESAYTLVGEDALIHPPNAAKPLKKKKPC